MKGTGETIFTGTTTDGSLEQHVQPYKIAVEDN